MTVTCDTYDCVQLETALQTASLAGPDALCSRDHTPEMRGFDEFYGSYGSNIDGFSFERDGIIDNNQWDFENGTFTQAGFIIQPLWLAERNNQSEKYLF